MSKETLGLNESKHDKGELEKLQQDIKTKERQFDRYKFLSPLLVPIMRKKILGLKNKLTKEANQGNRMVGLGFPKLIEKQSIDEVDLESYQNFLIGTDENFNPVLINNTNQHMTLYGGSGSGKSVFLFNIMRQILESGGGSTFIDGKGDEAMLFDFLSWAKQYNRENDVYILDFTKIDTNKRDKDGGMVFPTTNTFNLFKAVGIEEAISIFKEIVFPPGEKQDFFSSQAAGIYDNVALILKYLEKQGERITLDLYARAINLNAQMVQGIPPSKEDPNKPDMDWIINNKLNGYEGFWIPKSYGAVEDGRSYSNKIIEPLNSYGFKIFPPGDDYIKEEAISEQLQVQIGGYAATALKKLSSLSNSYPHIFNSLTSDINFTDVISEGKLVYIRIPYMKIGEIMSTNIGSLLINSFRSATGDSLGGDIGEDSDSNIDLFKKEQLRASPTHLLVLDELAAFVGDAKSPLQALLAQARSVNISCILSSQESSMLSKGEGGESFLNSSDANAQTKVFLKITDKQTRQKAIELIDKTEKVLNSKSEVESKYNEEDIMSFLSNAKDGLGVVQSGPFGKFITSFHQVDPENVVQKAPPLNK
jgi:intracellular multiplication protein IcmO